MRKLIIYGIISLLALGLLIQLITYGRDHTNPPANYLLLHPAAWLSPAERKLLFDELAILAAHYQ